MPAIVKCTGSRPEARRKAGRDRADGQEVDESLIGGFVLRYSDKMIDSSVKRKFKELKTIVEDNSYIKKY
jgi:hypothetical protein